MSLFRTNRYVRNSQFEFNVCAKFILGVLVSSKGQIKRLNLRIHRLIQTKCSNSCSTQEGARHCRKPLGRSVGIYQNQGFSYKIWSKYFQFFRSDQNQGFCMEMLSKDFYFRRIDQKQGFCSKIWSKYFQFFRSGQKQDFCSKIWSKYLQFSRTDQKQSFCNKLWSKIFLVLQE